jgi:hypothetical protein
MSHQYQPIPSRIPIAAVKPNFGTGEVVKEWEQWLRGLAERHIPLLLGEAELEDQSATIAQTPFALPSPLAAGTYRINYFARVTRAATTSSSLTVTIHFTHGGVAQSIVATALTGNTTTTLGQAALVVEIDEGTTIDYEITYASSGETTMQYTFIAVVESIR